MDKLNDNIKSTYVIRRRLAELRPEDGQLRWQYWVDNKFQVCIYGNEIQEDQSAEMNLSPVHFNKLDVHVFEVIGSENKSKRTISLVSDPRFSNYKPIKYEQYGNSDGDRMPLDTVCQLIKYLHTISKLSAFW